MTHRRIRWPCSPPRPVGWFPPPCGRGSGRGLCRIGLALSGGSRRWPVFPAIRGAGLRDSAVQLRCSAQGGGPAVGGPRRRGAVEGLRGVQDGDGERIDRLIGRALAVRRSLRSRRASRMPWGSWFPGRTAVFRWGSSRVRPVTAEGLPGAPTFGDRSGPRSLFLSVRSTPRPAIPRRRRPAVDGRPDALTSAGVAATVAIITACADGPERSPPWRGGRGDMRYRVEECSGTEGWGRRSPPGTCSIDPGDGRTAAGLPCP